MKSDWQVKKLSDIVEFNPTERLSKGAIAKKIPMDMLQPFTKDIFQYELQPYTGGAKFRNGDTIMARITPCLENGKVSKVNIMTQGEVGFGSTEYIVLRAIPNVSDPDFIYYLTISDFVRAPAIKSMVGSSGRQRVQQNVLETLELPIPPYDEQKKIAAILSALDEKIATNLAINDNLEQQMFLLYKNITMASSYANGTSLSNLCAFQEGYVNPAQTHPEYFDGDVKWLRAVDINESFITETSRTLTKAGFESAKKSALLFKPNTIAISKSGTIGRLGIIADYMCGNRAVINIAPNDESMLAFIYCFLKNKQKEFPDMAVGSVQKNLYVSLLEPLTVFMPDDELLTAFNATGASLLSAIHNNCIENTKLANLRDTLLPKLISGEIDVSAVQL